jgi:hypothetical protein
MQPRDSAQEEKAALFLSCAEEDEQVGSMLNRELRKDFEVFYWQQPRRGGQFIRRIEDSINSADIFLAVLSRSYLNSYWCNQERMLALQREAQLQEADSDATFIYVANVAKMPPTVAGFFGSYVWLNMTSPASVKGALDHLSGLSAVRQPDTPRAKQVRSPSEDFNVQVEPMVPTVGNELAFRNRVDELNQVLNGLTNAAGSHFWHVVAPPQLGKTWFLERLSAHPRLTEPDPWVVRQVNLRSQPPDVHDDAAALLRLLFEREPTTNPSQEMRLIAQQIGRTGNPNLCIVDSAELLTRQAADTLRLHMKEIGEHVQRIGNRRLRLAFIAASRRDEGWKGIIPQRLSPLSLTEFTSDVIQEALHDLSKEMETEFSADWLKEHALRVQCITEGLPALLVKCLQWIRAEHWFELERLEDQDRFEELLVPYVERELLTSASLLWTSGPGRTPNSLQALIQAYKVLAPYRLFTRSHLRHHRDLNPEFRTVLDNANWSMTDLWGAISASTLVRRPSTELWKEIHPAIRRLLCRYFYRTDAERAAAHDEACQFMAMWSHKQVGTEQCVGLVECLWHEANALRLRDSSDMELKLTESAQKYSSALGESTAYVLDDLRAFAAERMADDAELEEIVNNGDDLLNRLVAIVLNPEGS